jgi:hypothetical protein
MNALDEREINPGITQSSEGVSSPTQWWYEAGRANTYHLRFAPETYVERCFYWNLNPKFGLIAADPISVDGKLRNAEAHLPRGFLTRMRHDSGRGERLSGVFDDGGHGGQCPLSRFRAHLAFSISQIARCADARDGTAADGTAAMVTAIGHSHRTSQFSDQSSQPQ